jgi:hypothetical protein
MNAWGRIFFAYEGNRLTAVKGQPLENHTENCLKLLEHFHQGWFHSETRDRLMRATSLHDEGKKETFWLKHEDQGKNEKPPKGQTRKLSYSFAGHRFRVPEDDPYVVALIRSHHEFSVEQVNREKAGLTGADKAFFADDLYLLCMSDHLEAELAVKTIEDKTSTPRTFMEFVTIRDEADSLVYRVIPWPFEGSELSLSFNLKSLPLAGLKDTEPNTIQDALNRSDASFVDDAVTITLRRC